MYVPLQLLPCSPQVTCSLRKPFEKPSKRSYVGGHHVTSPQNLWDAFQIKLLWAHSSVTASLHFFLWEEQLCVPLLLCAKADYKECSLFVFLCFAASECVGITVSPRRQTVFSRWLKKKKKRQFMWMQQGFGQHWRHPLTLQKVKVGHTKAWENAQVYCIWLPGIRRGAAFHSWDTEVGWQEGR